MKKCSCCNAISGKNEWSGHLCDDCNQNSNLRGEFEWYRMMIHHRCISLVFLWTYPMLILLPLVTGRMVIEWWAWPLCIAAWIFSFVTYRKRQWSKRMAEQREKLWLLKMSE